MKNNLKFIKILLSVLYVLLLIVTIMSFVQGGFAQTGGGVTVPSNWLFYPFIGFIVFTSVQAILYHVGGEHMQERLFSIMGVVLCVFKCAAVIVSELIIDGKVFTADYIGSGNAADFGAGVWYTLIVIFFIVLVLAVMIVEVIGSVKLKKVEIIEPEE